MYIFRLEMYIFKLKMKNFGGFASFSGGEKKLSGRLVRIGLMRSPDLAVYEQLPSSSRQGCPAGAKQASPPSQPAWARNNFPGAQKAED